MFKVFIIEKGKRVLKLFVGFKYIFNIGFEPTPFIKRTNFKSAASTSSAN